MEYTIAGFIALIITTLLAWKPISTFLEKKGWKRTTNIVNLIDEVLQAVKDGKVTEEEVNQIKVKFNEVLSSFENK